ncbi:TPA: nucleoside triphosphate pyrophosphohydrolase family protein [Burkholderia vietnamiensis]|nr:nucleoside triphosphate pyrophosphohydrolase family protein [Burkholderia vietnamiensis]
MVNALAQQPALTIAVYAEQSSQTDRFASIPDGSVQLTFGFFGEVGGLLSALKKVSRDHLKESETQVAGEEIGDALWYLVAIANASAIDPQTLGERCVTFLRKRFGEHERASGREANFRQIDGLIAVHGEGLESRRAQLLGELARASGEIVGHVDISQLTLYHDTQTNLLAQLLCLLGLVAASFLLKLEDIARDNLVKIHGRWPGQALEYTQPFDASFPAHEQLPRIIPIEFIERRSKTGRYVVQQLHGVYIGDRLTDNSIEEDDYRFHDVFHLAYVAHLGWSPVIRALLKVKRKSVPEIDENEDGARAMIIEEGIATWIFNHARHRDYYADVSIGKLEYGLLKQVRSMVDGFEVAAAPLWQWERAILDGFRVFRELRREENRGGRVTVDMQAHTLSFEAPTRTTE